jgi:polysaccharide deacetylase family protein (PEP-CTERM system associated)
MNILTFDIEDWFHILDNPKTSSSLDWIKYESRLERNLDIIFQILKDHNQNATFFILGWVAEKYPNIIKRIVENGFEIGSHSHLHQLIYTQTNKDFEIDLKKSIDVLEDISGTKVKCFRAPGFSITSKTPWVFEILLKNGIEIDSSIFPVSRSHGGFSRFGSSKPVIVESYGMKIKEFPINTSKLFCKQLVFSGGGYFRFFPYNIIKRFTNNSDYVMSYFHPRDFDPLQPMVPGLNSIRKFKSYYGLNQTENKLRDWLSDFNFIDLRQAVSNINWDNIKVVKI